LVILDLCGVNYDYLLKTYKKIDKYLSLNKRILLFGCISEEIKIKY
jgi:hypothetical protein